MKVLRNQLHAKIYYCLLLILAFVLPIHERLVSPVILLIGLNWLLELNFVEKFRSIKSSRIKQLTLLFGLTYLPYLVGIFYSENFTGWSGAYFALEVKLSLLVFPLLFSTINPEKFPKESYYNVLKAFVAGCITSSIVILFFAFNHYFDEKTMSVFYYSRLSDPFHPSYLAMYYSFTIAILAWWIISSGLRSKVKPIFAFLLILYFQLLIVLLGSKAGIIGLILVYSVLIIYSILKLKKSGYIPVIQILGLVIMFVIVLMLTPSTMNRFKTAKNVVGSYGQENIGAKSNESTMARILIWSCALEIIQENPLWGVGPGDVNKELMKKYDEKKITVALNVGLNAHNQFLQTYMATGFWGFILIISGFFIPLWFAIKHKKILYLLFILLIVFNNFVESMLERQAGVVFYAFFNALLFYFAVLQKKQSNLQLP